VKGISFAAKLAFGSAVVAALAVYVSVVDLGVNAGRIHRGVTVGTIDVGGLTQIEAADRLESVGREMRNEHVTFEVGTNVFEILPADLKWWPYAEDMALKAMSVGRKGGLAHAASTRWEAWFGGVELKWKKPGPRRVAKKIEELSAELDALGYDLDEEAMRRELRHAIWDWPRRDAYQIPLSEG
jgi:hypothetical protein